MNKTVAIIDYGLGNILSAQQSFLKVAKDNKLNVDVVITSRPETICNSTHIVLPGQGAFETCMNNLIKIKGMVNQLTKSVFRIKHPFWVFVLECNYLQMLVLKMVNTKA